MVNMTVLLARVVTVMGNDLALLKLCLNTYVPTYNYIQEKEAFKQLRKEGMFKDEEERKAERRKSVAQQEKEDFEWAMKMMNKEKIDALKEEELLRAKMKQAYKVCMYVCMYGSLSCGY